MLLRKLRVKREAEIDDVARISPLREKSARFTRCPACNVRGLEERYFVMDWIIRRMSREKVSCAAANDATAWS